MADLFDPFTGKIETTATMHEETAAAVPLGGSRFVEVMVGPYNQKKVVALADLENRIVLPMPLKR